MTIIQMCERCGSPRVQSQIVTDDDAPDDVMAAMEYWLHSCQACGHKWHVQISPDPDPDTVRQWTPKQGDLEEWEYDLLNAEDDQQPDESEE